MTFSQLGILESWNSAALMCQKHTHFGQQSDGLIKSVETLVMIAFSWWYTFTSPCAIEKVQTLTKILLWYLQHHIVLLYIAVSKAALAVEILVDYASEVVDSKRSKFLLYFVINPYQSFPQLWRSIPKELFQDVRGSNDWALKSHIWRLEKQCHEGR